MNQNLREQAVPFLEVVRENIRRARTERGLSQKDVARKLSESIRPRTTQGWVSQVERSKPTIGVDDVVCLALLFGMSPIELLLPREDQVTTVMFGSSAFSEMPANLLSGYLRGEFDEHGDDAESDDDLARIASTVCPLVDEASRRLSAAIRSGASHFADVQPAIDQLRDLLTLVEAASITRDVEPVLPHESPEEFRSRMRPWAAVSQSGQARDEAR